MDSQGRSAYDAPVLKGRFAARYLPQETAEESSVVYSAVERVKAGDKDALRYLYIRYADSVYGYVKGVMKDEHEAEDVTQQVFVRLMGIISKYERRDVPFAAWIQRVAHNMAVDNIRRRRSIPTQDMHMHRDASSDHVRHEYSLSLREALEELPPDQREVLVMRHVVGLSPGEIAERLNKSEGSSHGLHHRGRGTLKAALTRLGSAPITVSRS
jgi:RNA polymerase sigma-70 factor (ECF subfamily)